MTDALLVTKHHKWSLVAPSLSEVGWHVETLVAETDSLGAFAGDVPRPASPIETARRKALLGADGTDAPWLLASEGSISHWMGGIHQDAELVVAVERVNDTMVVGRATGFGITCTRFSVDAATTPEEIVERCGAADLPRHHLVVAASDHHLAPIGALADTTEVLAAVDQLRGRGRTLVVQTDLRAHLCPSRQPTIIEAATDLAARLATPCPRCGQPGYGHGEPVRGLPCLQCRQPTALIMHQRLVCPWCAHHELIPVAEEGADPSQCGSCNP